MPVSSLLNKDDIAVYRDMLSISTPDIILGYHQT